MGDQVILPLPPKLDKTDRKILYELEQNSRQSLGKIAKKVRCSKQTLHYRVQRLVKEGVISGFITAIDTAMLGYSKYYVWMQLSDVSFERRKRLYDHLVAHENVHWVAVCGGKYDLAFSILAKDTTGFMHRFKEIVNQYPNTIKDYIIITTYDFHRYARTHYVSGKEEVKELYRFFESEKIELDKADLLILSYLAKDSRVQIVDLSNKIGIAPNTVRSKIKNMERLGIIKRYITAINTKNAGYTSRDLLISLHNMSEEKEKELEQYCLQNQYVSYMMRALGRWDMYLSLDSYSEEQFQEFLIEFRSRFSNVIRDFEYMSIMEDLKFDFFPMRK
jgi:DNA-binding Lrp family transcriptional regulator